MKSRSRKYFHEKTMAKTITASDQFYMKKRKVQMFTSLTFAEQRAERRRNGAVNYRDVLAFRTIPISIPDGKGGIRQIASYYPTPKPLTTISDNPFIRAHLHFESLDHHSRYTTHVFNIARRQCSRKQHMVEYYEWLMPMLTSTQFIVTGDKDLTAIPVPDNRFPDYYFKSEFVELMREAYKKYARTYR